MKLMAFSSALIAASFASPVASAETLDDISGEWSCIIQLYNGQASGTHVQVYEPDGSASRTGYIEMEPEPELVVRLTYDVDSSIQLDGNQMTENDYAFSYAEGALNGVYDPELAEVLTSSFGDDTITVSEIVFLNESALVLAGIEELTSCIRLD